MMTWLNLVISNESSCIYISLFRWYKMAEKTWGYEGGRYLHQALKAGTYLGYQGEFTPYIPKDSKSRTTTTFYAALDPKTLGEGEQPFIKGNLASLGTWEGAGIPMLQLADNPALWWAQLEIPFAIAENCKTGIFEYKYLLGDDLEGRHNRRIKKCQTQYYYVLQKDPKNPRYSTYKQPTKANAYSAFMQAEFGFFMSGSINAANFMSRFENCNSCLDPSRKASEEVTDKLFKAGAEAKCLSSRMILSLLAGVGRYGLTKEETQVKTTGTFGYGTDKVVVPRPSAGDWCWTALDDLDVGECMQYDLKQEFGTNWIWCLIGLREAAERACLHGSYRWLRVIPFLNKHKQYVAPSTKGESKRLQDEFLRVSTEIRVLAASSLESAIQEEAANAALADEEEKKGEQKDEKEGKKKEELLGKVLAKEWLISLVQYAPSIQAMSALFSNEDIQSEATMLLNTLGKWIKNSTWKDKSEIKAMADLVSSVPALMRPELPANLVTSSHIDVASLFKPTISFITLCSTETKEDQEADGGINKSFVALDHAVKEWFRRNHSLEKEEKKKEKKATTGIWGTTWATDEKAEPVTQAELDRKRLAALSSASNMLDALFKIPFFNSRPSGLLFELSRCHFMKGEPHTILQAICSLGQDTNGLQSFHPHLISSLSSRGVRILEELVLHLSLTHTTNNPLKPVPSQE